MLPRLLPRMDADVAARIQQESERIGITIHTGIQVNAIATAAGGLTVRFTQDGAEKTVAAAMVANGAGRVPAVEHLNLGGGRGRT